MNSLVADKDKHQWFTPAWAAEALISYHFPELTAEDVILEPTCGTGNFLKVLPDHFQAYGVEMDPVLAEIARKETGRHIITGDFLTVDLPMNPTAVIGNPPFEMELVDAILGRCHDILPENGKFGMILPAYAFQTASRLVGYKTRWSIYQEMIPRNLFKGMMKPLCFAIFRKDRMGKLQGFCLFDELHDINNMKKSVQNNLNVRSSPWKEAVLSILGELGGRASLDDIYKAIEPKRPSGNTWWREKVRQTLRRCAEFSRVGHAEYALTDTRNMHFAA